jgi:hypothetical protein
MENFTIVSQIPNEKKAKITLYLFLLSILFIGYSLINKLNNSNLDTPKPVLTNAMSCVAAAGAITAKAHAGTVAIPVGTNITGLEKWSLNTTWVSGIKPAAGDDVIIPENAVVVLDQDITVKSILVKGKLIIDLTKNINITAEYIMVMGAKSYFEWGTETRPYKKNGIITLTGNDPNAKIPGTDVESKCIMVMDKGRIEMHSLERTKWVKLNKTANVGENTITLSDDVNWLPGEEIILTSTAIETKDTGRIPANSQTERLTIKTVSGNVVTLNQALKFRHFGKLQNFSNGKGKTWTLDERAEVGNLSRNIKIRGSQIVSDVEKTRRFGGHVMIMGTGAVAHFSAIEFSNMGQAGILGRYPFHWHLVGNAAGQYIKNSVVKDANNRAITVHGTQNTNVSDNVVYNVRGHAIFLEDGNETGVTINRNLVAEVLKPTAGLQLLASDRFFQKNRVEGPSGIWLMNPQNDVTNNAVVGTGSGFWYSLNDTPHGAATSLTTIKPNKVPFKKFEGNSAHGCYIGFNTDFADINGDTKRTNCVSATYFISGMTFTDFTGFSNYRAVWFRGTSQNYDNFKMANNVGLGAWVPTFLGVLKNSLTVGYTENSNGNINFESYATSIYDGNLSIENSHFENFDQPSQAIFTTFGGAHKHLPAEFRLGNTFKKCNEYMSPSRSNTVEFSPYISFVEDQSGILTGAAGNWITNDHPFIKDDSFKPLRVGTGAYHSPNKFARLGVAFRGDRTQGKQLVYMDYGNGSPAHNGPAGTYAEFPVMTNSKRIYRMRFTEFIDKETTLWYEWGRPGEWIEFFIEGVPSKLIIGGVGADIHPVAEVSSLAALKSASSSVSFYNAATNYMHFRLKYINKTNEKIVLKTPTNNNLSVTLKTATEHLHRPYQNKLHKIGNIVQSEHFDYGGQGVGYFENIDWSLASALTNKHFAALDLFKIRQGEIVDIKDIGGGNYSIIDNKTGDWWKYSYDINKVGTYPVYVRAQGSSSCRINILVNGVLKIDKNYTNTTVQDVNVGNLKFDTTGKYTITVKVIGDTFNNFDSLKIGDSAVFTLAGKESPLDTKYIVFPSPNNTGIYSINESSDWEVYTLTGKKVSLGSGKTIDISNQAKGLYIVKIGNTQTKILFE